jgi:hypothetical protein
MWGPDREGARTEMGADRDGHRTERAHRGGVGGPRGGQTDGRPGMHTGGGASSGQCRVGVEQSGQGRGGPTGDAGIEMLHGRVGCDRTTSEMMGSSPKIKLGDSR